MSVLSVRGDTAKIVWDDKQVNDTTKKVVSDCAQLAINISASCVKDQCPSLPAPIVDAAAEVSGKTVERILNECC